MKTYTEPARTIPVAAETEVLIAGGGPAGIGAALGAARAGAKVMIVEQSNALGGMATGGMMSHWSGGSTSPLLDEIMHRACESTSLPKNPNEGYSWCISHECLKSTLLQMMDEAGVKVQLYTQIADVIMDGNRVAGIITESKSGREAIMAKVVIDATGDGDVAARAGAEYELGREGDHLCQPVTLMFRIGGVDYSRAIFPGSFESYIDVPKGEIQALGKSVLTHPAGHVLLYRTRIPGEVCVNMTNVINIDATDVRQLTEAEKVCRRQMDEMIPFLREYAPGYEDCYLVTSASNVGVRETRHFKGLYTVTAEDILEARVFDDWIAQGIISISTFTVSRVPDSTRTVLRNTSIPRASIRFPTVPVYRSELIRFCFPDATFPARTKLHSNYRVMPICLNIGQGVGTAAAIAAGENILPRNVDVKKVQALLGKAGVKV